MLRVFGGAHVGIFHGAFKGRSEQTLLLLTSILCCFLLSFVLDVKGKVI